MEPANQDHQKKKKKKKSIFEMLLTIFEIGESSQQTVDGVVYKEIFGKNTTGTPPF